MGVGDCFSHSKETEPCASPLAERWQAEPWLSVGKLCFAGLGGDRMENGRHHTGVCLKLLGIWYRVAQTLGHG